MKILTIRNLPLGLFNAPAADYVPTLLAREGHSVIVVGRAGGSQDFLRAHGVQNIVEIDRTLSIVEVATQVAEVEKPDIVHVFSSVNYLPYPRAMRRVCSAKYVLDIRSPLLVGVPLRYWIMLRNRMIAYSYDRIVTSAREAAWTAIGRGFRLVETGIGVDISAMPVRIREAQQPNPVRLVYIGSVGERRKTAAMIDAVLLAAKDAPIRFDIYGDATPEIVEQTATRDPENVVRFCGLIPRDQVHERLLDYDIGIAYVPRTLYEAGPPLKTLEYLANGLPTVATNTVGNARYIQHEQNGLLAADDVNSFAKGIVRLALDPALRHDFSRKARAAAEPYDWQRHTLDRLLPVFEELVETRTRTRN